MQRQFVILEESVTVAIALEQMPSPKFDSISKLMLTANMIVGTFEIIAVLNIFSISLRK